MSVFLAAASNPVAVLFLCGRPLDNGGAGADGVNSSFNRNILSRSIWYGEKLLLRGMLFVWFRRKLDIGYKLKSSIFLHTSFPLVSPPSNHSTVTLNESEFTPETTAEWIRPLER